MADEIPDVLNDVAEEMGREALRLFRGTVRTWRRKPTFQVLTEARGGDVSILVGTDDEIYGYVDRGTRPHVIRPRNARRLRFNSVFTAKTTPGSLQSGAGGSKPPTVYALEVLHPGTQPRGFTERILKIISAQAGVLLTRRIKRWLRGR
jgi:hypothetical protein